MEHRRTQAPWADRRRAARLNRVVAFVKVGDDLRVVLQQQLVLAAVRLAQPLDHLGIDQLILVEEEQPLARLEERRAVTSGM